MMWETAEKMGRIVRSLGGTYTVEMPDGLYQCRARGIFRKNEIKPVVGDMVSIERLSEGEGFIQAVGERKNLFIRPPLANIDTMLFVLSVTQPVPNFTVTDKLIAIAEYKGITPVIVVTKADFTGGEKIAQIYQKAGFDVCIVNNGTGEGVDDVMRLITGKICAFTGNSGVGKSSLLNNLDKQIQADTGEISEKLGRGRHTTRHVELYQLGQETYIADTPGFSSIDTMRYDIIRKDALQYCFREFSPYIGQCRFTGCSHTTEKGCAVLQAMTEGKIGVTRHDSYRKMYEEAKAIKEWEL